MGPRDKSWAHVEVCYLHIPSSLMDESKVAGKVWLSIVGSAGFFVQPDPKVAHRVEVRFVTRPTKCSHTLLGFGSTAPAKERISSIPKGV